MHLSDADGVLEVGETGRVLLGLNNGGNRFLRPELSVTVEEVGEHRGRFEVEVHRPKVGFISPGGKSILEIGLKVRRTSASGADRARFRLRVKVRSEDGSEDQQEEYFSVGP